MKRWHVMFTLLRQPYSTLQFCMEIALSSTLILQSSALTSGVANATNLVALATKTSVAVVKLWPRLHSNIISRQEMRLIFSPILSPANYTTDKYCMCVYNIHGNFHHVSNTFIPKSGQCQISLAASPEILHHTVWRSWLFIAYSAEKWLILPILTTSLIHFHLKVGRMYFLSSRVKVIQPRAFLYTVSHCCSSVLLYLSQQTVLALVMGGTIVAMMKYVGHQVRDYLDDYSKVIFFSVKTVQTLLILANM